MDYNTLFTHARAFVIALLSVALMNAAIASLQFIGAHIPDLINFVLQMGAAHGAVVSTTR